MDYKKYSLEKLEEWMHDALSCGEATPQEIYDVIKKVTQESFDCYQKQAERSKKLLDLLDGVKELDFNLSNTGIGTPSSYMQTSNEYTFGDNKFLFSCYGDDQTKECRKEWSSFWENDTIYVSEDGDLYSAKDKVVKWQLPVQVDGLTGDCYINLPDDLLERAGLKEGDTVEWIDRNDGSFELRKVNVSE